MQSKYEVKIVSILMKIYLARSLINYIVGKVRTRGVERLYWMTAPENTVARSFYAKIATQAPWIIYEKSIKHQ